MKKFAITMAFGLSLCGVSAYAESMTGYVSDAKCAAKHTDGSEKSMKCVQACVKGGAAAVFVSDGKVYKIDDASKVAEHLGHKVTINGKVDGETISIESVKMATT